jgi:AraC-like DNA-binding protein
VLAAEIAHMAHIDAEFGAHHRLLSGGGLGEVTGAPTFSREETEPQHANWGSRSARLSIATRAHGLKLDDPSSVSPLVQHAQAELTSMVSLLSGLSARVQLRDALDTVHTLIACIEEQPTIPSRSLETTRVPIHGAEGEVFAHLELLIDAPECSDAWLTAVQALARRAARALSERVFRSHHEQCWVIAAQRCDKPATYLVVAIDGESRIVGADHHAREFFRTPERRSLHGLPLAAIFETSESPFNARNGSDMPVSLCCRHDGARWCALITPPAALSGREAPARTQDAADHGRPRLALISYLRSIEPRAPVKGALPGPLLRRTREYIDANLDSPLSIEDMAETVGISTSHFSRSFRKAMGMPPHDYVLRRRVARARHLLMSTELRLADIALQTGFSDQAHFTNRFREQVGLPPRTYRARYR